MSHRCRHFPYYVLPGLLRCPTCRPRSGGGGFPYKFVRWGKK